MGQLGTAAPIVTINAAQAFVRVETGQEEALLAGLIRAASGLCEAFLNQVVIAREVIVEVPARREWQRLPITPVRSVTEISGVDGTGGVIPLPADSCSVDIESNGDGWVRVTADQSIRGVRARATVGMATDENGVPEPVRQGVLRLVAHLFAERDGPGGEIPAVVTALWRAYRRMRIA